MSADLPAEITALILAWDSAPYGQKLDAKKALNAKLLSVLPDASPEEIEQTIQHFRNRQVKDAKAAQRKRETPKM